MADENKIDHTSENLEDLPPEELQKRIKEDTKNARRSLRFAATALIAIIAVCISWFVANDKVTMTGTQISAESNEPFEIASVGERQKAEENYLKDENGNTLLSSGTQKTYDSYIDIDTKGTIEKSLTYYTGGSGVAWYMNGEENLVPGFGGKLEFYLIAKRKGLHSVTVNLNLEGYTLDDSGKKVERLENNKIQNLLKGHILFFRHFDDTYGYYDWLGEEPTITVDAPKREEGQTFVPNIPYKVTLYWKWPQYFRNYIYTQRSMYGDLFTDEMVNKYSEEYTKFIDFVNSQKTIGSSKLFYVKEDNEKNITEEIINNQMSDEILNTCNSYYNQADEYIGKNTQYVYVKIEIAEVKTDVAN